MPIEDLTIEDADWSKLLPIEVFIAMRIFSTIPV